MLALASTLSAQTVYDLYPERVKPAGATSSPQKSEIKSDIKSDTHTERKSATSQPTGSKQSESKQADKGHRIVTGFTGGMMLHAGYAFAQSPDELFHNGSLQNIEGLSSKGVMLGLGGALRLHLINHIHLGAEGGVSTMPLMKSSSVRTGWGGALCGFYATVGKVQLGAGGVIGGGANKRLFVPDDITVQDSETQTIYNASFTKTPFFLLDPYVCMEIGISSHTNLIIKLDYMLPFGKGDSGIDTTTVRWSNFLSPSGPRLYVGVLFGPHKSRKDS